MNLAFNRDFIDRQGLTEQLFNHGSLQEFQGETGQGYIVRALDELDASINGLDEASRLLDEMIEIIEERPVSQEFQLSLERHIADLEVNSLERIGDDRREVSDIADILIVLRSEFDQLDVLARNTKAETEALMPDVIEGQFVARVLENETGFNTQKISLGFGRDSVRVFMSTACHATILAVEDHFPTGYEALYEPKIVSDASLLPGEVPPADASNGVEWVWVAAFMLLAFLVGGVVATLTGRRVRGSARA